jgi:hypothetical protein
MPSSGSSRRLCRPTAVSYRSCGSSHSFPRAGRAGTPLPPRLCPTSLQFSAGFRDEFAAVAGFALWRCVQETNLARDDFPLGALPILSVGPIADGASPLDVHSHTPP